MSLLRQNLVHVIARVAVSFVWIYHGAVPKLIFLHADELTLIQQAGAPLESVPRIVWWIGWAEIVAGLLVLFGWPSVRWPLLATIVFGIATTVGVAIQSPSFLVAAFNPVSLNVQLIALSWVGLLSATPVGQVSKIPVDDAVARG